MTSVSVVWLPLLCDYTIFLYYIKIYTIEKKQLKE